MVPGLMNAMMPGDMFGMSNLIAQAAQNPQLIPLLAQAGIEPPATPPSPMEMPFADVGLPAGASPGLTFNPDGTPNFPQSTGGAPNPLALTPDGRLSNSPAMASAEAGVTPPMPAPDMANWGASPETAGLLTQDVMGGGQMGAGNPFPTPIGGAQGNPFPIPIGTPPANAASPMGGAKTLADALRGVKAPPAPDVVKPSTPAAPQSKQIDLKSNAVMELLSKILSPEKPAPMLRLGQTIGGR